MFFAKGQAVKFASFGRKITIVVLQAVGLRPLILLVAILTDCLVGVVLLFLPSDNPYNCAKWLFRIFERMLKF
jgi:hypothetical protein